MPYAEHNGVRIYWEAHGQGEPIVLVMGLSFTLDMWYRLAPQLATTHRVILLDNRGVGRSDIPSGTYGIGVMAEDAISVMDAAGVAEPAVVIGASMGGMIAQEMVLRYPERFRALVLGCTACGPLFRATWPKLRRSPGFWHWLRLRGEERERALVKLLYSDTTPIDRIEEDIQIRAVRQPPVRAVLSQLAGIVAWSSHRRLSQIKIPTLIVHGDQDQILPCQNGKMIAAQMPHAEFHLIPDCGHMITTDQPEISLSLVTDFLRRLRSETSVLSAAPASEAGDAGPV